MKLTRDKENELALKVARAITEALNPPSVISVRDAMRVLGVAMYVYIVRLQEELKKEE